MTDASTSENRPRGSRGITLVELIITMAVMGIILAATLPLFTVTHRGFTSLEMGSVLPAAMQEALAKIQSRLVESRRLFDNTAAGNDYLSRLPTLSPARLTGTRLPTIATDMFLSLSSGTFVPANVGNSLFFASTFDARATRVSSTTVAPGLMTVKVDTFMFNYYYLAQNPSVRIGGLNSIQLREWHSVPYADYRQLTSFPPSAAIKQASVIQWLFNDGVTQAWDSVSDTPASAFYTLTSTGGLVMQTSPVLVATTNPRLRPDTMIEVIEGAASGGFRFGVSPNTAPNGPVTHKYPVPQYAQASGNIFPAGFETIIVGPASARHVVGRLVVAGEGNFHGTKAFENVLFVTSKDNF